MTIYPLKLGISNAFLVKDKTNILVDTGSKSQLKKLLSHLKKLNCPVSEIDYVLITHAHWDHCGNVAALRKMNGNIKIIVHTIDAKHTISGKNASIRPFGWLGKILKPFFDKSYDGFKADVVFNDILPVQTLGINGYILHTPGHTEGSCSLILDDKSAIVGDLMMGAPILTRKPSYHFFIEDYALNNASLRDVISRDTVRFYVGHGSVLNVKDVFLQIGKKCIYH